MQNGTVRYKIERKKKNGKNHPQKLTLVEWQNKIYLLVGGDFNVFLKLQFLPSPIFPARLKKHFVSATKIS